MPEDNNYKPSGKSLNRRDLLFLVLILVFGAGTLVYGFYSLSEGIKGPLVSSQSTSSFEQNDELSQIIELQTKDTDNDGLTDYDEINIYGTSPYLEDTDGDGFSDKQEIETGNDPNCLPGEKCYSAEEAELEQTDQERLYELYGVESETGEQDKYEEMFGESGLDITPEFLRQELLDSGVSQDVLNQYSDDDLMRIYSESVLGIDFEQYELEEGGQDIQEIEESEKTDQELELTEEDFELLNLLTADQVRKLLIESGADEEVLNQFSDEELIAIYKEVIKQENK